MPRPTSFLCLALAGLAACDGKYLIDDFSEPVIIIDPAEAHLLSGASTQLHVSGWPADSIRWSVADPDLASVDATGLIATDPCGRSGNTFVTATWATRPEIRTRVNVFVYLQMSIRVLLQSITDAATRLPVAPNAIAGTVDVGVQYAYGDCRRIHRISLMVISGNSESEVASLTLDPEVPLTAPAVLRWDTRSIGNGDYTLVVEADLGKRLERSATQTIRVLNQD